MVNRQIATYSLGIGSTGKHDKQKEKNVILCVLSTSEYFDLRSIVDKIDPSAFMFVTKSSEVRGYGFSLESDVRKNKKRGNYEKK